MSREGERKMNKRSKARIWWNEKEVKIEEMYWSGGDKENGICNVNN